MGKEKTMLSRQHRAADTALSDAAREREVRREIADFLIALSSYPDRFARDPYLSFEQHLFLVGVSNPLSATGGDRRRSCQR
jgi:hypothetical protein